MELESGIFLPSLKPNIFILILKKYHERVQTECMATWGWWCRVCRGGWDVRWLTGTHPGISGGDNIVLVLSSKDLQSPLWVRRQSGHHRRAVL